MSAAEVIPFPSALAVIHQRLDILDAQVRSLQMQGPSGVDMRALELRIMLREAPHVAARLHGVSLLDIGAAVARLAAEHLGDSCSADERAWWERLRECAR